MNSAASGHLDAVVIGSGFGGGITAARLAEAGARVLILERGPWRDTLPVQSACIPNRVPFPRGMQLYTRSVRSLSHSLLPLDRVTLNKYGLFDLYISRTLDVICSSNVGGGSHVYSAVHGRPIDPEYWNGHCEAITEDVMAPYSRKFLERMGSVVPTAENRLPHTPREMYGNSAILAPPIVPAPRYMGFLLPADPDSPKCVKTTSGLTRRELDYRAGDDGFLGSPTGAKATIDCMYIHPAMQKGLEVRPMCEVTSIELASKDPRRFRIHYIELEAGMRRSVEAPNVIVAAGTMNTLRLLLKSRDIDHGLAGMEHLGERFSGNGDIRGFWNVRDKTRDFTHGGPSKGGVRLRQPWKYDINIARNGMPSVNWYPFPEFVKNWLRHGMVISAAGTDAMDGVASYRGKSFHIDFNPANSPVYQANYDTMQELARRSGHRVRATRKPSTVHPLGGACVGDRENRGVVDGNGEVHGIPGLYVADAAALPAPVGTGPTLTIATWAEHVADRFVTGS